MKKLLSILISFSLLAWLYWKVDWERFGQVARQCDWVWLGWGLAMFFPITAAIAWRLQVLGRGASALGFFESLKLILSGSVMNLVLPAKMGDIAKAWFIAGKEGMGGSRALALVIYEKACDLLSLLLWCCLGLFLFPAGDFLFWALGGIVGAGLLAGGLLLFSPAFCRFLFGVIERIPLGPWREKARRLSGAWMEIIGQLAGDRRRLAAVAAQSIGIWFLHLLQIWFFILALRAAIPLLAHLALTPLAILAGLLPFTLAGIGTRDAALIFFYRGYADMAAMAALGMLCTVRYLLPALFGLPFFQSYLAKAGKLENLKQSGPAAVKPLP